MRLFIFLLLIFIINFLSFNCGGTRKIATFSVNEYALRSPTEKEQTKSNVTILVEPLSPSKTYNFPELFSFDYDQLNEAMKGLNTSAYFPKDLTGNSWCYTFGAGQNILTAFKVKITNKTPHILRMKDSRIYLVAEGSDPIAAVTKLGNPQLYTVNKKGDVLPKSAIDKDESLIHWITYYELKYEEDRPKGFLSYTYPIGIASQVILQNLRNYKLINDVSKEILPDFSYEGILLFPALVSWDKVNLVFYDITTKTDAAGNPIEKTKFNFDFDLKTVNMWYDSAEKRWKIGTPPVGTTNLK